MSAPTNYSQNPISGKGKFECTLNASGLSFRGDVNINGFQAIVRGPTEEDGPNHPSPPGEEPFDLPYIMTPAGPSRTSNSSHSSTLPSNSIITFKSEDVAHDEMGKIFTLIRALHANADEWMILISTGSYVADIQLNVMGISASGSFCFNGDDIRKKKVEKILNAMNLLNANHHKWEIHWSPQLTVEDRKKIRSLDGAIEMASKPDVVCQHLKRPSTLKEWEDARGDAKRKTAYLVRRYWICVSVWRIEKRSLSNIRQCSCYPNGTSRDRHTELNHLKNSQCHRAQCGHTRCENCEDGTGRSYEGIQDVLIDKEWEKNGW